MPDTDDQKLRGGYYTPAELADFLARSLEENDTRTILEPSAGDGALVRAAAARLPHAKIDAHELMSDEAAKVRELGLPDVNVSVGDIFTNWDPACDATYDAVIGNPPFIRYQTFPEHHREAAFAIMRSEGLHPSRLTNAWVPFVVLATRALRPGGRMALVVPAELMQVGYAGELREYLARRFSDLAIYTFAKIQFPGILQETVVLLGTKSDKPTAARIAFHRLETSADLAELAPSPVGSGVATDLDHAREKWTQYYLSAAQLGLMREIESSAAFTKLGALCEVDVGIVTGRNEFFVLRPSEARTWGIEEFCRPLIGRSAQVPGLDLSRSDWETLAANDGKCLLLQLGRTPRSNLSDAALRYVEDGEARGHHLGYKCRIRMPSWWYVPSDAVPEAFMLRQVYDAPRIIANSAGAVSTDTVHRVRTRLGVNPQWLAAASVNSLTFAFSEIRGRSYGGGVLELEPTEAEGLPIPPPGAMLPLDELDFLTRNRRTDEALDETDRLMLLSNGLTQREIAELRGVWRMLSARRLGRGSGARSNTTSSAK